jgi:ADP-heptose:LPS heptosyltransferase
VNADGAPSSPLAVPPAAPPAARSAVPPAAPPVAVFLENRPFFGSILTHVPLLWELRRRRPADRILLFSPFREARLLVELGVADEVRLYRRGGLGVLRQLRAARPAAVFNLRPASVGIDLAVGLSGAALRAGFRSPLGRWLYSRALPHDTTVYRPRKYLALLGDSEPAPLDAYFRAAAARAGGPPPPGRYLGVLPGGGAGAVKLWGIDNFLRLCERMADADPQLRFVFVLGPQEREMEAPVRASPLAAKSAVLVDRPVPALAAAALGAAAAVGNDCGPGHLFQMAGCPYVCVMTNHDGRAPERILEWVDGPNRPFAVTTETPADIRAIPLEAVLNKTVQIVRRGC